VTGILSAHQGARRFANIKSSTFICIFRLSSESVNLWLKPVEIPQLHQPLAGKRNALIKSEPIIIRYKKTASPCRPGNSPEKSAFLNSYTANMRTYLLLFSLLTATLSFAQKIRPVDKPYIIQGVVADRETLKPIPDALLYNDSMGIMTTSDEKGYFKLVVPAGLIEKNE
jgi:hypothetical protein